MLVSYDEETEHALRASYSPLHAKPAKEPEWYEGLALAPIQGVKHGLDIAATMAAETLSPPIESVVPEGAREWLRDQRRSNFESVRDTRADPQTMGTIGQVAHSLGTILPLAAAGGAPAGIVGAAGAIGTGLGYDTYLDMRDRGVDEETAKKAGLLTGSVMAIGSALPPYIGKTIARQIASGVGLNVGLGMGERVGTSSILDNAGYAEMAKHYQALDGTAMLIDGVLGAAFPVGARMLHRPIEGAPKPDAIPPAVQDVDAAMIASQGIAERMTRSPVLHKTLEGLDKERAAHDAVTEQVFRDGVDLADVVIPHGVMDDAIPNPRFAREVAEAAQAIDEHVTQEHGKSLADMETEVRETEGMFRAADEAKAGKDIETEVSHRGTAENLIATEDFNSQNARDAASKYPDMMVSDDNGTPTKATDLLKKADEEFVREQQEAKLYDVAIKCAIGVGE